MTVELHPSEVTVTVDGAAVSSRFLNALAPLAERHRGNARLVLHIGERTLKLGQTVEPTGSLADDLTRLYNDCRIDRGET